MLRRRRRERRDCGSEAGLGWGARVGQDVSEEGAFQRQWERTGVSCVATLTRNTLDRRLLISNLL